MGNHLIIIITLFRGFAPAARASPGCDGAVLVVTIAEKFPERVMQKASQYAPAPKGAGLAKNGRLYILKKLFSRANFYTIFMVLVRTLCLCPFQRAGIKGRKFTVHAGSACPTKIRHLRILQDHTQCWQILFFSLLLPHLCLLLTPAELSRASPARSSAIGIP